MSECHFVACSHGVFHSLGCFERCALISEYHTLSNDKVNGQWENWKCLDRGYHPDKVQQRCSDSSPHLQPDCEWNDFNHWKVFCLTRTPYCHTCSKIALMLSNSSPLRNSAFFSMFGSRLEVWCEWYWWWVIYSDFRFYSIEAYFYIANTFSTIAQYCYPFDELKKIDLIFSFHLWFYFLPICFQQFWNSELVYGWFRKNWLAWLHWFECKAFHIRWSYS